MAVQAVLTDMDGTFIEFRIDYLAMRRVALHTLEELGLSRPGFTVNLSVYDMLCRLRDATSASRAAEAKKRVYAAVEKIEAEAAEQAKLLPDAKQVLTELRQMGKKIVVVTNNGRSGTAQTLEKLGVSDLFDFVLSRDDAEMLKPDPGMIVRALELAKVGADEAILVGDAVVDVKAARRAGVRSVAVPTGSSRAEQLLREEPDFVIGSFSEVPRLVLYLDG